MNTPLESRADAVRRSCHVLRSGLARSVSIVTNGPVSPEELRELRAIAANEGVVIAEFQPGVIKLRANGLPVTPQPRRIRMLGRLFEQFRFGTRVADGR